MLAARGRSRWIGAYHQQATSRKEMQTCPHQVSESPFDPVPGDGVAHGLADDEPHDRGLVALRGREMDDQEGLPARRPRRMASANSSPRRMREAGGSTGYFLNSSPPSELTAGGAATRCRSDGEVVTALATAGGQDGAARRGCACAAGSRGSSRDGGCSAGKYACSRWAPG